MTLAEYLSNLPGISKVQTIKLYIGKLAVATYDAAIYEHENWGQRIYVIGDLPNYYKRDSNTVFKCGIGEGDLPYYIAGFFNTDYLKKTKQSIPDNVTELHPFGDHFTLARQEKDMVDEKQNVVQIRIECI